MRGYRFLRGVKMLVMVVVACIVFGYVVMQLWNWLMPSIFGLRQITYFQAVGLLFLSKLLLGGFHRHGGGRGGEWRRGEWKRRMEEKFSHMSPEERERFRAGMRDRCFTARGWGARARDEAPAAQSTNEATNEATNEQA